MLEMFFGTFPGCLRPIDIRCALSTADFANAQEEYALPVISKAR